MKLSEILKDWPEKMKSLYPAEEIYTINYLKRDRDIHNTALTSCDREIDRGALINEIRVLRNGTYPEFNSIQFADHIISTMPQWLKRIENGKISS